MDLVCKEYKTKTIIVPLPVDSYKNRLTPNTFFFKYPQYMYMYIFWQEMRKLVKTAISSRFYE